MPGTAVTVTLDGKRPLIGEIQAPLTAPTYDKAPRRIVVSGMDQSRVSMISAVLHKRASVPVGTLDIYLSTVGGMRLTDPSSDLAVAAAMASAVVGKPLPPSLVVFGEAGLAGDLRRVTGMDRRLAEAARLGFSVAVVPTGCGAAPRGLRTIESATINDALRAVLTMAAGADRGKARGDSRPRWTMMSREHHHPLQRLRSDAVASGDHRPVGSRDRLRDGLERILRGRTGALIVLGYDERVQAICDGGFPLDVAFAPTRLRELSKMDGAVVLEQWRPHRAGQRPAGSRPHHPHRGVRNPAPLSAERAAIQTGCPVISVSHSMNLVTVYVGASVVVADSATILSRANQAIAT